MTDKIHVRHEDDGYRWTRRSENGLVTGASTESYSEMRGAVENIEATQGGDFEVVGKHIGNAQSKYVEAERRLDRFESKLERASEHEPLEESDGEQVALDLPRALDAA